MSRYCARFIGIFKLRSLPAASLGGQITMASAFSRVYHPQHDRPHGRPCPSDLSYAPAYCGSQTRAGLCFALTDFQSRPSKNQRLVLDKRAANAQHYRRDWISDLIRAGSVSSAGFPIPTSLASAPRILLNLRGPRAGPSRICSRARRQTLRLRFPACARPPCGQSPDRCRCLHTTCPNAAVRTSQIGASGVRV